ncbi:MAG: peptidoglycan-associated lipoprotein Pal [Gallionella sp.]|nr:peptidoglycan-associated lipoprotein Pal [Gallionella sp.]
MKKLILSAAVLSLLAACGSAPQKEATVEPKQSPVAPAPTAAVVAPAGSKASTADETSARAQADADTKAVAAAVAAAASARAQADANTSAAAKASAAAEAAATARAAAEAQAQADAAAKQALKDRSVYFPFDVDAVQQSDLDTIIVHAQNLAANPKLEVRVEGNADERGSSEYNLALGQRRANNTKKSLVLGGARSSQIEAVSYGEEKPKASGHDETAWAQNRRADIEYSSGK